MPHATPATEGQEEKRGLHPVRLRLGPIAAVGGDDDEQAVANAKLIAAAPDLLSSLAAPLWLVWSNEHAAWWGPNGCHYYTDISAAGRYTLEEAMAISRKRLGSQLSRITGNPGEMIQPAPEWVEARTAAIAKATA